MTTFSNITRVALYFLAGTLLLKHISGHHLRRRQDAKFRRTQWLTNSIEDTAKTINSSIVQNLSSEVPFVRVLDTYIPCEGEFVTNISDGMGSCHMKGALRLAIIGADGKEGLLKENLSTVDNLDDVQSLWKFQSSLPGFQIEIAAHLLAKIDDDADVRTNRHRNILVDYTSCGRVQVDGATIEAGFRINEEQVSLVTYNVEFGSNANFTRLGEKVPKQLLDVAIGSFVSELFRNRLKTVIEREFQRAVVKQL